VSVTTRRTPTVELAIARRDLHHSIRDCRSCPLAFMGNGPVRPIGPTPNDIMILSEAPTRTDDKAGIVTHSGDPSQLLRKLLHAQGIELDDVFFANTISCWPGFRTPAPAKGNIVACRPNVRAQVSVCDPAIVLTLGATALSEVTDNRKRKITTARGRPFRPLAGPLKDRWVFPTWHPGALKKNPGAVTALAADIATFVEFYTAMRISDWPEQGLRPWVPTSTLSYR
jgi:uracil-DNA glycosylase family 4